MSAGTNDPIDRLTADNARLTVERDAVRNQILRISEWLLAHQIDGETLGGVDQIAIQRMVTLAAGVEELRKAYGDACRYIDANVCDPDTTAEMWDKYQIFEASRAAISKEGQS